MVVSKGSMLRFKMLEKHLQASRASAFSPAHRSLGDLSAVPLAPSSHGGLPKAQDSPPSSPSSPEPQLLDQRLAPSPHPAIPVIPAAQYPFPGMEHKGSWEKSRLSLGSVKAS